MTRVKVISCILKILFDDTVSILRILRDSMWTLTGLSGEFVTFDQNGRKCSFEFLSANLPNWRFGRIKSVIQTIGQIVKAEGFGNSYILKIRNDDVIILRNVKNYHFRKNQNRHTTTIVATTTTTRKLRIIIEKKQK